MGQMDVGAQCSSPTLTTPPTKRHGAPARVALPCEASTTSIGDMMTPAKVIKAKRQSFETGKDGKVVVKVSLKKPHCKLMDLIERSSKKHMNLQSKSVFKKHMLSTRELIHGWW